MKLLTAPWVVPVSGPPIPDGGVLFDGSAILEVGSASSLARSPATETVHVEDAALVPAFINAHTHLELTGLGALSPGLSFTGWLKEIIRLKITASPEDFLRAKKRGEAECFAGGTALAADVVSRRFPETESALDILHQGEVISARPEFAEKAVEEALLLQDSLNALFLHAPYTLCREAFIQGAKISLALFGRYFTHLAESDDELEFCLRGTGPIPDELYAGLPVSPPVPFGCHPLEFLEREGLLGSGSVLVHMVKISESQIELLKKRNAGLVLCPRSNLGLGVGIAPGRAYVQAGLKVGLGTDSSLSAGNLSMLEEARAAVEAYGISPLQALHLATLGGARALGAESSRGSLSKGKSADILALSLGRGSDPGERLLNGAGVVGFWSKGERVN